MLYAKTITANWLTAPSIATAVQWAPVQLVVLGTKIMNPLWATSAEASVFSMAICPNCARTFKVWHHSRAIYFYLAHLGLR